MPTNTKPGNTKPGNTKTSKTKAANSEPTPAEQDQEILEATVEAITAAMPIGLDPAQTAAAAGRLARSVMTQPRVLARRATGLNIEFLKIAAGRSDVEPAPKDRRFADDAFSSNPLYKRLAQTQVATERALEGLIDDLDMDEKSKLRSTFVASLVTSALAPTNTLAGNPAALQKARETKGRSLYDGVRHALHDLRHNGAMPSMVDTRPFIPGDTIAATPGSVVYSNAVLELMQYSPTTTRVRKKPVFIVPPQINKYYILDLAPQRSLIEHLVSQGQQVFCISWCNAQPEHREWDLDTYATAILDAMDAALEITKSEDLNLLGVCAGGMTSAALLGKLASSGDTRVNSATFLVTVLDWNVPSTIGTMVSRPVAEAAGRMSQRKGVLAGEDLNRLFAWLRPNDLVWNYWVNNYLMGKNPPAFDVLAWNGDSTNLPAGLHADFLSIATSNGFATPGEVELLDTPIDLGQITCDSYVVGAETDHITPWRACFSTVNFLGGDSEFVLSSQGHIQALVNPSGNPKGRYFTNPEAIGSDDTLDPDEWLEGAAEHAGSWWDHWSEWLSHRSGTEKAAPKKLGSPANPATIDAPGSYILD